MVCQWENVTETHSMSEQQHKTSWDGDKLQVLVQVWEQRPCWHGQNFNAVKFKLCLVRAFTAKVLLVHL